MRYLTGIAVVIFLAACNQQEAVKRFTPADADHRSREYIALVARGQVDSAEQRLLPVYRGDTARSVLGVYAALLKEKTFDTTRVIGAFTNTINGTRHVNLAYELHDARGWYLVQVATVDTAGDWAVEQILVEPLAASLEEQNRFTLEGKTVGHYAMLLLTMTAISMSVGTCVFIATRRGMPGRWRWAVLSLFGVAMTRLNWTTGLVDFKPIYFQLFSGGFFKLGPAAPWFFAASLPVGAIVAIDRYRRWRAKSNLIES